MVRGKGTDRRESREAGTITLLRIASRRLVGTTRTDSRLQANSREPSTGRGVP